MRHAARLCPHIVQISNFFSRYRSDKLLKVTRSHQLRVSLLFSRLVWSKQKKLSASRKLKFLGTRWPVKTVNHGKSQSLVRAWVNSLLIACSNKIDVRRFSSIRRARSSFLRIILRCLADIQYFCSPNIIDLSLSSYRHTFRFSW